MTVQQLEEVSFEKAVFGGYDMRSVDDFIEQCIADVNEEEERAAAQKAQYERQIAALQQENADLKEKMKVLVDKVEEYRGVDDGMRRTLMTAKTIAQEMVDKARAEAENYVEAAEKKYSKEVEQFRAAAQREKEKYELAKNHTAGFLSRIIEAYRAQADGLEQLGKREDIGQPTAQQPQAEQPVAEAYEAPEEQPEPIAPQPAPMDQDRPDRVENDIEATRRFKFTELKFGDDYDPNA